jgi:hypothetical protein
MTAGCPDSSGLRGGVLTTTHHVRKAATFAMLAILTGCGGNADNPAPSPADSKPKVDRAAEQAKENSGRVKDIQEKCGQTTEEGKAVLGKVKAWKPVVNERPSDKTLDEISADYVSKGLYAICWSSSQKTNGKWKVVFHHIDIRGSFQDAEWEYDPATGEIKPFNAKAMEFWYGKL